MASLADIPWPVRTSRLLIRRATADDADAAFAYRSLESVSQWIPRHSTDHEAFAELWGSETILAKFLVAELDGRVIGDLMLAVEDAWGQIEVDEQTRQVQAEIGWCLDPAYEGKGYATEAVRAVVDVAFGVLGLRRLVANAFAANVGSTRLMERLGMRREAYHVRDSLHRSGEWLDGVSYALLAEEWPAAGSLAGDPPQACSRR